MNSGRLRILVLGPGSNPNSVTGPLIGYSHGEALAQLHEVTFVIEARDEEAVRKAKGRCFTPSNRSATSYSIDSMLGLFGVSSRRTMETSCLRRSPFPFQSCLSGVRGGNCGPESSEVSSMLYSASCRSSRCMASPFAFFLRKGPIPFVIGPLNGGVPWPKGFSQLDRQRAAAGNWAAHLRDLYRFLPFARSTYREGHRNHSRLLPHMHGVRPVSRQGILRARREWRGFFMASGTTGVRIRTHGEAGIDLCRSLGTIQGLRSCAAGRGFAFARRSSPPQHPWRRPGTPAA